MKNIFTLGILLNDIDRSLKINSFSSFFWKLKSEARKKKIDVLLITPVLRIDSFDVVYDIFFSNTKNDSYRMKKFFEKCEKTKKPVFNSRKFTTLAVSKWNSYKVLLNNKKLKKYLIKTFLLKDFKLLENFLEEKGEAILKLNIGQKGKGVFLIKKIKDEFFLVFFEKKIQRRFNIKRIEEIKKFLKNWPEKRYIFQEKIDVAKYKGRIFDIRVLLLRSTKNWNFLIGARIAPSNSFLSNIYQGGVWKIGKGFYYLLKNVFPNNFPQIIQDVKKISIEIANFLEEFVNDNIFEIGIDFALDKKGRIWIIEVNSKPGRGIFQGRSKEFPKKIVIPLINFAQSIYKKNKDGDKKH